MSLLEFLIAQDEPLTTQIICEKYGKPEETILPEIEKLLSENQIHKRDFQDKDGKTVSVYWSARLIPFVESKPIVTSPFSDPFDHSKALERLNDAQLAQEKIWLQTHLRKLNSEYENLAHRSKHKFSPEDEKELDDVTIKWVNACQEMLYELKSKLRQKGTEMSMTDLIKNLQIDPRLVYWNPDEEDFETPK
ncbi:hypothetical protein TVAG_050110 [Trichomonas vaginalis G3]|uniref:Swi5-dependent recombination DNA repair protein 1 homolog n=1 Tax=Trichomonas vaginalis (strain ATCC PRA-98 / G3) TaxID=412133 RepID=A2EJD9_TRIV3|nr:SWI5-dependent recombination DNA repair protein 1-like protein family [Trichomonas vaginalis G3]EAY07196.1 hypothetical protein TVAG_050110 [Trichomonas vaginalis G3]KAI5533884.1 SWI5-dependent recombination DNA repair protein 1-like protein family [Trichomonas vaginalis G3]|eukprot:XP_001319419.1 hypothetical protein [Trichomonas vaginalis G3]